MEDSYACIQDMMIDDEISVTYYAVFDGHGGADCAQFLRDNLHIELKNRLIDQIDGIRETEDFNQTVANCIESAFEDTDNKYRQKHL
jgi:serine/threonine protein phosphatase PrpC